MSFLGLGESEIERQAPLRPSGLVQYCGGRWPALLFTLGRRQPRPNLGAQPLHRAREILTRFPSIKEFVGNTQRGQDRGLLGLDDVAGPHRILDHLVHVLGYCARTLRTLIASDRILVTEDGDPDYILLRTQRAVAPSCCCLRNRTRSIICCVRSRAVASRLASPAF